MGGSDHVHVCGCVTWHVVCVCCMLYIVLAMGGCDACVCAICEGIMLMSVLCVTTVTSGVLCTWVCS